MKRLLAVLVAALVAQTPLSAGATPIDLDTWYSFKFSGPGSSLEAGTDLLPFRPTNPTGLAAPDGPWTFTLAAGGTLTVIDLFDSTDQFEVFDDGTSLGLTSTPTTGSLCGRDVTCVLEDDNFSRGTFALAAGAHSITGTQWAGNDGGGTGAFMVSAAVVPLPASMLLLLSALGLAGGAAHLSRRTGRHA